MKRNSPASFERLHDAATAAPEDGHVVTNDRELMEPRPIGAGSTLGPSPSPLDAHMASEDKVCTFGNDECRCASIASLYAPAKKIARRRVPDDDADGLMARELTQLTLQERERVYEDIHGVVESDLKECLQKENDSAFVKLCLEQMQDEISRIRRGSAYERALWMRPGYVMADDFRIMFLRCERWDPRKAGRRVVQHFELKLELFGLGKLVKDITYDDLDEDDRESLSSGAIQLLPVKDRAGRSVFVSAQKFFKFKTWKNQGRVWFYVAMVNLESVDAQRKGVVSLIYNLDSGNVKLSEPKMREMIVKCSGLMHSLPARFVSTHWAFDASSLRYVMSLTQKVIGTENRVRFRAHYGTHLECQYALMSFGIDTSPNAFPIDTQGNIRPGFVERFVAKRQQLESARDIREEEKLNPPSDDPNRPKFVAYPNPKADVVLGRGKPFQKWPGNLKLTDVVEARRERHKAANRSAKTAICREVVDCVRAYGGRFLRRDEKTQLWVEVDDQAAREKIGHSFRSKQKKEPNPLAKLMLPKEQPSSPPQLRPFSNGSDPDIVAENHHDSAGDLNPFDESIPLNFDASISSLFSNSLNQSKDMGSVNRSIFNLSRSSNINNGSSHLMNNNGNGDNNGSLLGFFHQLSSGIGINQVNNNATGSPNGTSMPNFHEETKWQ